MFIYDILNFLFGCYNGFILMRKGITFCFVIQNKSLVLKGTYGIFYVFV